MASRKADKVDPARVFVRWDEPKKLALLQAMAERPFYCSLFFSDTAHLKRYDIPRSEAIFDITMDFLAGTDELWFTDMEERRLIKKDTNGEWQKTDLWSINKIDQAVPTYRMIKIFRTNYRASLDAGVEDSWTSWADVKKADRARHDSLKNQNPYFFATRKLYKLAEANPPVPLDRHQVVSTKTATPRTSYTPPESSISHVEIPVKSPAAPRRVKTHKSETEVKPQVKLEVDFSPSKPHLPPLKPPMPTFTKYKLSQPVTLAPSAKSQPTLLVSTPEMSSASLRSPFPSHHSDIPQGDSFADAAPPYQAGLPSARHDAAAATTRPVKGLPASPRQRDIPTRPPHSQTPTPEATPLPQNAVPTGPRALQSAHTAMGTTIPRRALAVPAPAPSPVVTPVATAGSSGLANPTHQSIIPRTSSAPPINSQDPTIQKIDWKQPIFTSILLEALHSDSRLRSTLLSDRFPAPADNPLRAKWKTERDLYLRLMVEGPGQAWLARAKEWKWVGEKPGTSLLKATVLWPSTAVYDFVERLEVLSESWEYGEFESIYTAREIVAHGTPTWTTIMTSLFGPPGKVAIKPPRHTAEQGELRRPRGPNARDPYHSFKRRRTSQDAHVPEAAMTRHEGAEDRALGRPTARAWSPTGGSAGPRKSGTSAPANSDRRDRSDSGTRTRDDFLAMIQLANYRKFDVADLPSKRRREYERTKDRRDKDEIFELGRVEIYAEGLIGCALLVTPFKRVRTYDNVAFNTAMIPCPLVRRSIQDLVEMTGGKRVEMHEIDTMAFRPGDHRFQVYLFRERSGASLSEQLKLGDRHVHKVGLLEYLQYVGQRVI